MTKYITWVAACFFSLSGFGQQLPDFSQYLLHQAVLNPAYTGVYDYVNFEGSVRGQWLGIEGAPLTQAVSVHMPIPVAKSGIGINVANDLLGAERTTTLSLAYSKKFVQKTYFLSAGIRLGLIQRSLDGRQLVTPQGLYDETNIDHQDDLLSSEEENAMAPDLDLGLYFRSNQLEIGVVARRLLQWSYGLGVNQGAIAQQKATFNIYGSYAMELGMDWVFRPHIRLSTDLLNFQTMTGLLVGYKDIIDFGLMYRGYNKQSSDALIGILVYRLGAKLQLAYSYDYPLSGLSDFTSQTHELGVNYRLFKPISTKSGKILYNPRFL